jgi:hypothetical protein
VSSPSRPAKAGKREVVDNIKYNDFSPLEKSALDGGA